MVGRLLTGVTGTMNFGKRGLKTKRRIEGVAGTMIGEGIVERGDRREGRAYLPITFNLK